MRGGRFLALLVVGLFGSGSLFAPAGQAAPSTECAGRDVIRISPGLSFSAPSSGTMRSEGERGTEECHGPLDGYQPTGTIKVVHSAVYGYIDPDTCGGLEAKAYAVHSVPTAKGMVELTNHFTASFNPLSDGVMSGSFNGDHFSGRFMLRPLEGDCITTPLTLFEGIWEGTWHGTGAPAPPH